MTENAEIGKTIGVAAVQTNYHDIGTGDPVLFIHGSGPGVSAWANWRLNMPVLGQKFRCIAPDMVGFGYTAAPEGFEYSMENWVAHLRGLVEALDLGPVSILGNSFGGALALAYAIRYPEDVNRLVLMGAVGLKFDLTEGLDAVWGYQNSVGNMKRLLGIFAFDQGLVSDDLAELRYRASARPGVMEAFSAMFPAPRQQWVDAMASDEADIAAITAPTLVVHGREDKVIPPENAQRLFELMPNSELHLFRNCGHWTQIEKRDRFNALLSDFLAG
ncbi:alpha/beta fold hydrolase [Profundibacter sp.]|uniref:alpha/beta fold hydrolase n=1 Tax=Profundibacter sp. TaxID=3101071 RepID=UPI003D0FC0E3